MNNNIIDLLEVNKKYSQKEFDEIITIFNTSWEYKEPQIIWDFVIWIQTYIIQWWQDENYIFVLSSWNIQESYYTLIYKY